MNDKREITGRGLRHLPWILLVLVAAIQISLALTADMSAWKGGGFGMFATTDGGPNRRIRAYLHGTEGAAEVLIPAQLQEAYDRVKDLPTAAGLDRFAGRLAAAVDVDLGDVVQVRLTVLRTSFEDGGRRAVESTLRERVTDIAP